MKPVDYDLEREANDERRERHRILHERFLDGHDELPSCRNPYCGHLVSIRHAMCIACQVAEDRKLREEGEGDVQTGTDLSEV